MKRYQRLSRVLGAAVLLLCGAAAAPASAQARISKLSDVAFGTLSSFASDNVQAQSVCAYSLLGAYHVTATGSGSGGAFTLASGGSTLPYEVQWNDSSGQTSGTGLTSGTALTGLSSSALTSGCTLLGPATSASLIVVIRAATLPAATAGSYSGVLTIILAPN